MGLDIESGFVAAAEFTDGATPLLVRAATGTLRPGLFHDGEVVDVDGLADQLKAFFGERKLSKRVRLGLASQRIVVRVLELPSIQEPQELDAAVRFQAQEELPMPLEQAVLEHRLLERFIDGESERMRVLVVAARRDSVEHLLTAARKAGLAPELVDLSAFAIVRALHTSSPRQSANGAGGAEDAQAEVAEPAATLYCYVGGLTNLAIAVESTCVFNRVLPNGVESMAAALAERRGLTLEHARQWLRHVGLERELEGIEGDREIVEEARQVLLGGLKRIGDEVRLSIEYYHSSVPNGRSVERLVVAGPGVAVSGFPTALEGEVGIAVEPRSLGAVQVRPGVLDSVDATQLTVAAGLALDEVQVSA